MGGQFTIIVIPDTQYLTTNGDLGRDYFYAMTNWIVAQKDALNIQAVLHVGDIVNGISQPQYEIACGATDIIKDAGIPFIPCRGNHDWPDAHNEFFGYATFQTFPEIGKYDTADVSNYYVKLIIEGEPYLFLSIDFGPSDEVMEWFSGVIADHPDCHVIIVTHSYMFIDGTRVSPGDAHNPNDYNYDYCEYPVNDGEDMWQKYLKQHPNVRCIFSGHHLLGNYSYRIDLNDHEFPVFQAFQNWQDDLLGGNGRICVYQFTPGNLHRIDLRVYDPAVP